MPTKEQVKEWIYGRAGNHLPPMSTEEIRKKLGWKLKELKPKN